MAEIKIEIGQRMLSLRKNIKKSQAEVAEYLGLTVAAYQNYETGRREANYETLSKLADFYGVTTDYLLGRSNEKPEPLAQLASEFNMSALEEKILKNYLALDEKMRGDLTDFLQKAVMEVKAESIQHSQIDLVSEKAIARSSDGDFKPAPTDEQFESFSVPADSDIDG